MRGPAPRGHVVRQRGTCVECSFLRPRGSDIITWLASAARQGAGLELAKIPNDTDGLKLISREAGVPAVDLTSLTLPLSILDVLTEEVARRLQILPLRMDDERLFVASAHPEDGQTLDQLAFL